jgi:phosphohistidine phosphatase SixA
MPFAAMAVRARNLGNDVRIRSMLIKGDKMQRRLIVMRHAKSSWNSAALTDHERPLNQRGRGDAPRVGAALVELGWVPDLVLSSDAQRTRETLAGMNESFPGEISATFLPSFYHSGVSAVREEVPTVDQAVGCLMVLGHNPGWEDLVQSLSGERVMMKTATAALLTRDLAAWQSAFDSGSWNLEKVIYPREL